MICACLKMGKTPRWDWQNQEKMWRLARNMGMNTADKGMAVGMRINSYTLLTEDYQVTSYPCGAEQKEVDTGSQVVLIHWTRATLMQAVRPAVLQMVFTSKYPKTWYFSSFHPAPKNLCTMCNIQSHEWCLQFCCHFLGQNYVETATRRCCHSLVRDDCPIASGGDYHLISGDNKGAPFLQPSGGGENIIL